MLHSIYVTIIPAKVGKHNHLTYVGNESFVRGVWGEKFISGKWASRKRILLNTSAAQTLQAVHVRGFTRAPVNFKLHTSDNCYASSKVRKSN